MLHHHRFRDFWYCSRDFWSGICEALVTKYKLVVIKVSADLSGDTTEEIRRFCQPKHICL